MQIKEEIRILGWDDTPFEKIHKGKVTIVGIVFRGGKFQDGTLIRKVEKDGLDATKVIAKATLQSKHYDQLRVLMLDGITYAGFNLVDIKDLNEQTGLPVIAVTRQQVNFDEFRSALQKLPHFDQRWKSVKRAGKLYQIKLKRGKQVGPIYYQFSGCSNSEARKIIKVSATRSLLPEPIRIAHLNATALVKGESYGRA